MCLLLTLSFRSGRFCREISFFVVFCNTHNVSCDVNMLIQFCYNEQMSNYNDVRYAKSLLHHVKKIEHIWNSQVVNMSKSLTLSGEVVKINMCYSLDKTKIPYYGYFKDIAKIVSKIRDNNTETDYSKRCTLLSANVRAFHIQCLNLISALRDVVVYYEIELHTDIKPWRYPNFSRIDSYVNNFRSCDMIYAKIESEIVKLAENMRQDMERLCWHIQAIQQKFGSPETMLEQ